MRKYESLARKREQDIQKTAEKAAKQAAKVESGKIDRKCPVYLSTLQPPHLQTSPNHKRTSRDLDLISGTNARRSYDRYEYGGYGYGYGYPFPFLVPVPIFYDGVGLGGCVAAGGSLIDPSGSCGIGGFNRGGGCGGVVDGGFACAGSEPFFFPSIILYKC